MRVVARTKRVHIELLNRQVQFKVGDIYFPKPEAVMDQLYGSRLLEGRVLEVTESDGGVQFAVIAVTEMDKPVIVRVDRIGVVSDVNSRGREP
jgi:hypothetical protein